MFFLKHYTASLIAWTGPERFIHIKAWSPKHALKIAQRQSPAEEVKYIEEGTSPYTRRVYAWNGVFWIREMPWNCTIRLW